MADDEEEEDYVFYGTPLPDFDDFSLLKKQAAELRVRDERGRQRFHGAFTGGFSAGYFNSVGSKEGWTPSNFSSSRSQKAGSFRQNAEDFMDDEDFGAFGIAPKTVRTTSNFRDADVAEPPTGKRRRLDDVDAIIPGEPPLSGLVKPVNESIGIQILKKMGWKHGQGIGPKVKRDAGIKIYGCSLGPLVSEEEGNLDYNQFEFAPDETPEVAYVPKDDPHGIGYSGLSTRSILNAPSQLSTSSTKTWLPKEKRKIAISGQAFGVGALEEDDDDIYGKEDMSQYDFSEFLGSKSDDSGHSSKKSQPAGDIAVLAGFTPSKKSSAAKKRYSLPDIPKNFQPMHLKRKTVSKSTIESMNVKLNPVARSVLLGEKVCVEKGESSSHSHQAERLRSRFCPAPEEERPMFPPGLIGNLSLKPFPYDEEKQKRYEQFLQSKGEKDELSSIQQSSMTEWQKQQEFDEFSKTSSLYRPFSTGLKSRFESKSQLGEDSSSKLLHQNVEHDTKKRMKDAQTPSRDVFEWHPTSLLCKRFNVPNPYPDSNILGTPHSEIKKPSLFGSMFFESTSSGKFGEEVRCKETEVSEAHSSSSTGIEASVDVPSREDSQIDAKTPVASELGKEKPPMDLFRDIFKSSSSEESDQEDTNTAKLPVDAKPQNPTTAEKQMSPDVEILEPSSASATSSKKQAFGVFANLDLDALNKRTPATSRIVNVSGNEGDSSHGISEASVSGHKTDDKQEPMADECYGPELPPPGAVPVVSDESLGQKFVRHKHSKHKHHKHKVKKTKKKKKKKKHTTKDDSSSSDDEDVPPAVLLEKLKEWQKLSRAKR